MLHIFASACSAPTAIDRYLLPAGHSAANPLATATAVDRWEKQMDGQINCGEGHPSQEMTMFPKADVRGTQPHLLALSWLKTHG